jgi:hypothetical protein
MSDLMKKLIDAYASRCRWTCAFVMAMVSALLAQDPTTSLPENYKREFENEYVRVTRVLYPPHAKLPAHSHTPLPSAYIYLNDSGPVAFKHVGAEYGAVTRPPTVARAFRVYRGIEEIHEVENLSELPSEFLRVEFKTDPVDPTTLRGKFLPEVGSLGVVPKVRFENPQVRITSLVWSKDGALNVKASAHPSLFVSLAAGAMGQASWLPAGQSESLGNANTPAGEALRIEFKTRPLGATTSRVQ